MEERVERRAEHSGRSLEAEICEIIRTTLDEDGRQATPQATLDYDR